MKLSPIILDRINSRFCGQRQGSLRAPGRFAVLLFQASPSFRERDKRSPASIKKTCLPCPTTSRFRRRPQCGMSNREPTGHVFAPDDFRMLLKKAYRLAGNAFLRHQMRNTVRRRACRSLKQRSFEQVSSLRWTRSGYPLAGSIKSFLKYGFINIFKAKMLHGGRHEKTASEGPGK